MLSIFGNGRKKPEPKLFKSHLFHGPYQPCEVFQGPAVDNYRIIARSILTGKDTVFPSSFQTVEVEEWMIKNGYSKAEVLMDCSIKIIW
jgi:hypothetical protein